MAKKKSKKTKKNTVDTTGFVARIGYATIIIVVVIIAAFQYGKVGEIASNTFRYVFGQFMYAIYFLALFLAVQLLLGSKKKEFAFKTKIGVLLISLGVLVWLAIPTSDVVGMEIISSYLKNTDAIFTGNIINNGGLIGAFLYSISSILFAKTGTVIVIIALFIIGGICVVNIEKIKEFFTTFSDRFTSDEEESGYQIGDENKVATKPLEFVEVDGGTKKKKKSIFIDNEVEEDEVDLIPSLKPESESKKKDSVSTEPRTDSIGVGKKVNGKYQLPKITILDPVMSKNKSSVNQEAAKIKGERLIDILKQFSIPSSLMATHIGPSVTKFEVKPESNVKISKIANIQDNIKMELAAKDIRIEAPIPGRSAVGIEVPNVETTPVRLYELMRNLPADKASKKLLFLLGKDLMGRTVVCELEKMPHLLIAGATGSGKSVCVNSMISTLLLRTTPDEVKMLLIDPKKVEFTQYAAIPHLIAPVISDPVEASRALKVIVEMMENRYDAFSKLGVRNIASYNEMLEKNPDNELKKMPWIVVIIDELADLMMVAGKEVEQSIQRITQLARAAGIHLIVATQRPSTDVITGIIKANIPSRIAFAVSSGIDSRTILDQIGAERLLGNGDMLYMPIGEPASVRLQGVYVTDEEVKRIAQFTSEQMTPMYEDAFIRLEAVDNGEDIGGFVSPSDDLLYEEAKAYIIETRKASTSSLQRRFGIGYNRAARIIDVLEEKGIIGPAQGSKPRDVYATKEENYDN